MAPCLLAISVAGTPRTAVHSGADAGQVTGRSRDAEATLEGRRFRCAERRLPETIAMCDRDDDKQ
jgi:hypothetical protein